MTVLWWEKEGEGGSVKQIEHQSIIIQSIRAESLVREGEIPLMEWGEEHSASH